LVVLYFSLRLVLVQREINRHVLLLGLVVTGLVEAVWGLLQLYGYTPSQHTLFRVTGSFFNPGPYAGYLAVALPMALCYARGQGYLRRGISLATIVGIALILPATLSRAAWIAAGTGGMVVLLGYLHTNGKSGIWPYL